MSETTAKATPTGAVHVPGIGLPTTRPAVASRKARRRPTEARKVTR